jgi:glutamine---fructose-6-phosphate transaminase (isomerizing)
VSLAEEINQQPDVLARFLDTHQEAVAHLAAGVRTQRPRYVLIAARGTSDNAARYAQYLWGGVNRLPVALATPSLFGRYGRPPVLEGALVVGISQSGQSPDIVEVVAEAHRQGCPTLAITNDPASPLATAAADVLDIDARPEVAVAATKTYTAELLAVAMVSAAMSGDETMTAALRSVPAEVAAVLGSTQVIEREAQHFRAVERCAVVGRGYHLATAFEWALKLQELCGVAALPYSLADFEHGPVALAAPDFPILAAVAPGPFADDVRELLTGLAGARGVPSLILGGASDVPLIRAVPLPTRAPEWAAPIVAIVGAQIFCLHLALAKGLDPDEPRGLHKVTRTT